MDYPKDNRFREWPIKTQAETETQPSAIAQAAAKEWHIKREVCGCADERCACYLATVKEEICTACKKSVTELAALIDKHIAPFTQKIKELDERHVRFMVEGGPGRRWRLNSKNHRPQCVLKQKR
jgi:hypothetical protein